MRAKFAAENPLQLKDVRFLGSGLNRPECILATSSGSLFTSDWNLGIARIGADGSVGAAVHPSVIEKGLLPNGFALNRDKSFLFANLSEEGGVWQAARHEPVRPFLMEVDGRKIPPANFVWIDHLDRIWITVSAATRSHTYFSKTEKEGFIVLVERGQARIVADGLTWTNELRLSPDGLYLYVNETFAGRTVRYSVEANGNLRDKTDIAMPEGTFPDGMAVDEEGGIWTICVITNRLIRVDPSGSIDIFLDDYQPSHLDQVEAAFAGNQLTRELILGSKGNTLNNQTSIAFGGKDRKTLYMGSISADRIAVVDVPFAGLRPAHWDWM